MRLCDFRDSPGGTEYQIAEGETLSKELGIGKKSRRDDICRIIEFDYLKKDRASPIPTIWKLLIILYFVNGNYRSGLSTALRGKHPELVVCRPFRA